MVDSFLITSHKTERLTFKVGCDLQSACSH